MKSLFLFLIIGLVVVGVITVLSFINNENNVNSTEPDMEKTIIMKVGNEPVTEITLPVNVTEKITFTAPINTIKMWMISPEWEKGTLDKFYLMVEDENKNNLIKEPFGIFQPIIKINTICPSSKEEVHYETIDIPIANNTIGNVIVKYPLSPIMPNNGTYDLKFSSFLPVEVSLPSKAIIVSDNTRNCFVENKSTKIILYNITFRLG